MSRRRQDAGLRDVNGVPEGRPSPLHARPHQDAIRTGAARVDKRTKDLLRRVAPGEVAVINHEDLDRVSAEELVQARVAAVVNAAPSQSGRYPNLGPLILVEAGVPLIDEVGPLIMLKVREGDRVRVLADRIYVGDRLAGAGTAQSRESVAASMNRASASMAEQLDGFAKNTVDFMQRERDLLFGGSGLPDLSHDMSGRHVLVVVRGYQFREDLEALRPYIAEVSPILVGVDGGADALLENGYVPHLIIGDMDSVSDRALRLTERRRGFLRRGKPTEVVLHAYPDGRAPGRARLEALGIPYTTVEATGMSEDVAFILAHEKRADLIVSVGSHGNLREFLDKGRNGMASTFLVRLRVGETLMDAKGVSRLYPSRVRARDTAMLVGSALFAMVVTVIASQSLRLYLGQLWHGFVLWLKGLL